MVTPKVVFFTDLKAIGNACKGLRVKKPCCNKMMYFCVPNPKFRETMKKSIITLLSAGLFLVAACGPSAEEKAAEAKRIQDSIDAVVEQARLDSIALAEEAQRIQDSITNALAEQARLDSIANAQTKSKPKSSSKPKPTTPTKEGSLKDKLGIDNKDGSGTQQEGGGRLKDKLK